MQLKQIISLAIVAVGAAAAPASEAAGEMTPYATAMLMARNIFRDMEGLSERDLTKRGSCMDECTDGCGTWHVAPCPQCIAELANLGWSVPHSKLR